MEGTRRYNSNSSWKSESFFEPAYLDEGGSEVPLYDLVNIQMKGYDYPVLENYGKFVHKCAQRFQLDVEEAWGTPCKCLRVTRLKPDSSVIDSEYQLRVYERNVQLADVPSTSLPIFVNFVEAALPAGVTLNVLHHQPEFAEIRYVPDYKLEELQEELETIKSSRK
ncbi:unnamed protein product [Allacma fusca]|uniref:Small ribosomal subunit protein uS10 domain-containing protein n=1 Tax=Allacma fusca TaxID=39272 RepID=A0A8J2PKU8_9HEXA|nr:unnamed protein product [Allacma fusca]